MNVPAVSTAKTASTRTSAIRMKTENNARARREITRPVTSEIETPPWRTATTSDVKSATAPMSTPPARIQTSDGAQPQYATASAGPTIGPAAQIDEKWCPNRTSQWRAGT